MSTLLKNLLGNGSTGRVSTEDLREVLQEIRRERERCEELAESARATLVQAQELGGPVAKAGSDIDAAATRLDAVERRLADLEGLGERFQSLSTDADRLGDGQREAEARIVEATENAERLESVVEKLDGKVVAALQLGGRLDAFLAMEAPLREIEDRTEGLRVQLDGAGERLARLREQGERVMDTHKVALSKFELFDRLCVGLSDSLEDKERRLAALEESLRATDHVQREVESVKGQLGTLKALGDYVAQKTSALEAQREVVERAVARADELDRAVRQIDAGVQQQQENARTLAGLHEQVAILRALHEQVLDRSREIDEVQRENQEQVQLVGADLAAMREEVRQGIERLEMESRGLESVTRRVADLRSSLSDFEDRFAGVGESARVADELHARIEGLTEVVGTLAGDLGRLDGESTKVHALRRHLDDMSGAAAELEDRLARMEAARPGVDAVLQDVEQLRGVHALVKDALERTQLAAAEVARVREEQAESRAWLAEVERALSGVEERAGEVRRMAPGLELVEAQVQRLSESMSAVEARREMVEDVQRRLAEVGTLGASLDDRSRELRERMDAAERRFAPLAAQAQEADRLAEAVASMSSGIEEAERGAAAVGKSVAALEARYESVEQLAERTRALQQQLEQRQHAIEEAARDLERASELRREAAESAQDLEEKAQRLSAELASLDRQAQRVQALSTRLDERAEGLQHVGKRVDELEERLTRFDRLEREVERTLERLSRRRSTVESLKADLERVFATAEETAQSVRSIATAHKEIEAGNAMLAGALEQLREVRDVTTRLDERKRQLEQAEGRLARAEALLIDVRSSLRVLQGQKVVVDQAVEKTGSLQFLLKQAEAMMEALRQERDMTNLVRAAVAGLEEEEAVEEAEAGLDEPRGEAHHEQDGGR